MRKFFAYLAAWIAVLWAALALSFGVKRLTCTPALDEKCLEHYWNEFGDFLFLGWVLDKGAFFVGLLALLAAGTSAIFLRDQIQLLRDQIQQSERHESGRRANKFNAIRSLMAIHLNALSNYISHNIDYIQRFIDIEDCKFDGDKISIDIMDIPSSTIEFLSSIVEYSNDDTRIIQILIGLIQIEDARLKRYKSGIDPLDISERSLNEHIVELYIIKQVVLDLYNYARRQSDFLPSSVRWGDVVGAMSFGGEELWSHDGALAIARPRHERQGEFVQFPF